MNISELIKQMVDLLMPELTPHETSMYLFLFRNSFLRDGSSQVRIGQRTIAQKYGRGPKMSVPSRAHIQRQLKVLEEKGCIQIGDTNRDGTLYKVVPPSEIPCVVEKLATNKEDKDDDYYSKPEKRKMVFERDQWTCQYCGDEVTEENSTLDHFIPKCKGGTNQKENLRTACLLCNSIKSGNSYEEAAIYLLKSIKERKGRKKEI